MDLKQLDKTLQYKHYKISQMSLSHDKKRLYFKFRTSVMNHRLALINDAFVCF